MATWRFESKYRHAVIRKRFIQADSERAARALADGEVAEGSRMWALTSSGSAGSRGWQAHEHRGAK
jgi:nicotinamide mononucleotide (NMN) deamidase PncC